MSWEAEIEELRRRGETVRVADDFSSGLRENVPDGVELVEGDIADPAVAARAVAGADYVLHQAAIPSVARSVADPAKSHRANVDGTQNVILPTGTAKMGTNEYPVALNSSPEAIAQIASFNQQFPGHSGNYGSWFIPDRS